ASLLETAPRALPDVAETSSAFILYTSGSTALPKGVVHSHASAAGIIASVLAALDRVHDESRIVAHDSVSHMGGWIEAFPFLRRGATVALEREYDVERFYDDLRAWRPTVVGAHVDHLWQIVRRPGARRPVLELRLSGTAPATVVHLAPAGDRAAYLRVVAPKGAVVL